MSERRMSVVHHGSSFVVVGTDQVVEAVSCLPAEVDSWGGAFGALYARRAHGWAVVESKPPGRAPRDAMPGVEFVGCRCASGHALTPAHLLELELRGSCR